MRLKTGRFSDAYRGDGYMASFQFATGWLLFGFRPVGWHLYFVKLPDRPAWRIYLGPLEIEFYRSQP